MSAKSPVCDSHCGASSSTGHASSHSLAVVDDSPDDEPSPVLVSAVPVVVVVVVVSADVPALDVLDSSAAAVLVELASVAVVEPELASPLAAPSLPHAATTPTNTSVRARLTRPCMVARR